MPADNLYLIVYVQHIDACLYHMRKMMDIVIFAAMCHIRLHVFYELLTCPSMFLYSIKVPDRIYLLRCVN